MLRYTPKCITTDIFVISELLPAPFRSLVCVVGNTGWRQREQNALLSQKMIRITPYNPYKPKPLFFHGNLTEVGGRQFVNGS